MKRAPLWLAPVLWLAGFVLLVLYLDSFLATGLFQPRRRLPQLAWEHLQLTLGAFVFGAIPALGLFLLQRRAGPGFLKGFLHRVSIFTETVPTVALLALLIPLAGYGNLPILLALGIYGIFPLYTALDGGFRSIPRQILENASGLGFNPRQRLWKIELPLALPVLWAGVRTTLVNLTAAATLGATVGAGGFGAPIIAGIRSSDPLLILQGALPSAFLALAFDSLSYSRTGPDAPVRARRLRS